MLQKSWQAITQSKELGALLVLAAFVLVFSVASPRFATLSSITSILTIAAEVGIVAIGVSMLMIAGEFDISVGSVMAVATLVFCWLANAGVAGPFALVICMLLCAAIGALNGLLTLKLKIPSFIVTLGAMMFWRGLHSYLTDGFPVMYDEAAYGRDASFLGILGGNPFSMFHMTIVWFLVLGIAFHYVLTSSVFGNHLQAVGGDKEAARNAGVRVHRIKLTGFILCSVLAGLAGVLNLSRYRASQGLLGVGMELESIAASVIGGNELSGGNGTVLGTVLGAILTSVIKTGLIDQGVSPYLYLPLNGVIIILAVVLNQLLARMRR